MGSTGTSNIRILWLEEYKVLQREIRMNNNTELHVVFGTGPLGRAVIRELVAQGKRVRVVNRSGKLQDVPADVEVIAGDATNPASVRTLRRGAIVAYHCAQPGYTRWPQDFPPITNGIIEGLSGTDTKLVFGDNLYMYGPVSGPITEDLPYKAEGHKGKTRILMANAVLAAHKSGKIRAAIGRGSNFYGPYVRDSTVGDIVFGAALSGKAVTMLGNPTLPHTYTFIDDFGKALVTLGSHDEALGQAWHIPNIGTTTTRNFVEMVFKEVGKPVKASTVSRPMVMLASLFNANIRETKEMLYEFEEPYIVDSSKYEHAFGKHATPYEDGIRQTIAWYQQHQ